MQGLTMDDYPLTLTTVARRAEQFHGAREIISRRPDQSIHRTTYSDVLHRARRLAGALADLGVGDGDYVATLMWNQAEHLECYFAIPGMGAVLHTLNPRLHPDELGYIVNHAQDKVIVVDETLLPILAGFSAARQFEHVIVVTHDEPAPEGMLRYEDVVASSEPIRWPEVDERQAAASCYTSGTTGRPKGVVYSHRAALLHALGASLPDALGISSRDTVLPVVPMFHANAWGIPYAAALSGAGIVFPGQHLDAVNVLDLLADERVTMTAGVPTVWMAMLAALDAESQRWDLGRLHTLIVGGAAVPPAVIKGFDAHGLRVLHAWGMTETSPLGSVCHVPSHLEGAEESAVDAYRARQGAAVPLVEIRAKDDEGVEVPWDDTTMGELEVRGPWVASGYHGGEGADKFTADGWFQTGDVVTINAYGCLKIWDRSKDLVKSGGEWISSVDLENLLMAHPAVAEAAVIAMPDEKWGERPLGVIAFVDGRTATDEELREHLSTDFAKWQLPTKFEIVEAIPRTATGKWKKTDLRAQFVPGGVPTAPGGSAA